MVSNVRSVNNVLLVSECPSGIVRGFRNAFQLIIKGSNAKYFCLPSLLQVQQNGWGGRKVLQQITMKLNKIWARYSCPGSRPLLHIHNLPKCLTAVRKKLPGTSLCWIHKAPLGSSLQAEAAHLCEPPSSFCTTCRLALSIACATSDDIKHQRIQYQPSGSTLWLSCSRTSSCPSPTLWGCMLHQFSMRSS